MASKHTKRLTITSLTIADDYTASWYYAIVLVSLIIILTSSLLMAMDIIEFELVALTTTLRESNNKQQKLMILKNSPPCDEIYLVGEGETLQTIGDKCGDPFIVEHNPHIHDPDEVIPGLVIKITPSKT
ncbi:hypothetical protein ACSBR2_016770 [Camellia fascicularis]